MFRFRVLTITILRPCRRCYAVASAAAETPRVLPAAAGTEKSGACRAAKEKEAFWMRDPKTGNWIPENRFADIDAAELRARLLPKK